jgi:hypothetical protein
VKLLAFLVLLPVLASASTTIVYNRSANPYIPVTGKVTESRICLDKATDQLRVYTPAQVVETCESVKVDNSDSAYPKTVCLGRKTEAVPADRVLVSRFTKRKVCAKWDYTDSKYPKCVKWESKDSEYSNSFTEMTYEPSDWRRERPVKVEEKTIETCQE